jgi:hypothetical protein
MEKIFIKVYKKDTDLGFYSRELRQATYHQRMEYFDKDCSKGELVSIIEKLLNNEFNEREKM